MKTHASGLKQSKSFFFFFFFLHLAWEDTLQQIIDLDTFDLDPFNAAVTFTTADAKNTWKRKFKYHKNIRKTDIWLMIITVFSLAYKYQALCFYGVTAKW